MSQAEETMVFGGGDFSGWRWGKTTKGKRCIIYPSKDNPRHEFTFVFTGQGNVWRCFDCWKLKMMSTNKQLDTGPTPTITFEEFGSTILSDPENTSDPHFCLMVPEELLQQTRVRKRKPSRKKPTKEAVNEQEELTEDPEEKKAESSPGKLCCSQCNQISFRMEFDSEEELINHIVCVHLKWSPFACRLCEGRASTYAIIKEHTLLCHPTEFNRYTKLQVLIRAERSKLSALHETLERSRVESGEGALSCRICERKRLASPELNSEWALLEHLSQHIGYHKYRCCYCIAVSHNRYNMAFHIEKSHRQESKEFAMETCLRQETILVQLMNDSLQEQTEDNFPRKLPRSDVEDVYEGEKQLTLHQKRFFTDRSNLGQEPTEADEEEKPKAPKRNSSPKKRKSSPERQKNVIKAEDETSALDKLTDEEEEDVKETIKKKPKKARASTSKLPSIISAKSDLTPVECAECKEIVIGKERHVWFDHMKDPSTLICGRCDTEFRSGRRDHLRRHVWNAHGGEINEFEILDYRQEYRAQFKAKLTECFHEGSEPLDEDN